MLSYYKNSEIKFRSKSECSLRAMVDINRFVAIFFFNFIFQGDFGYTGEPGKPGDQGIAVNCYFFYRSRSNFSAQYQYTITRGGYEN